MSRSTRDYLGPYRLIRQIHAGRASMVWEAAREADQQRVALKVLTSEYAEDKEQLTLLKHEHTVGSKLIHPCIIRMYDLSLEKPSPYLAMELSSTRNLKQMQRDDAVRLTYFLQKIIDQAAQGLAHMHQQGWIHRDVKPGNYVVDEQGEVKLIDFSIAEKSQKGLLSKLLGGKSKVQGTRTYMSPEQIRGEQLDVRADIYSFGCVLFELIAGKAPFTAVSPNDLLNKHLNSAPPTLGPANDNATPDFCNLVGKMMAKKRDDRPATFEDFLTKFRNLRLWRTRPKPPEDSAGPAASTPAK